MDPSLVSTFEGIGISDGYGAVHHVLRTGVRVLEDEIRAEIDRLYEIARLSLSAVWPAVERVAKALLKHGELDRDELDEAVGEVDIITPVVLVQRAHGLLIPRSAVG